MKKILCIGSVTADIILSPVDSVPPPGSLRAVHSCSTHVGGCAAKAAHDGWAPGAGLTDVMPGISQAVKRETIKKICVFGGSGKAL